MSEEQTPTGRPDEAGHYEIRLQGHLDRRWASHFEGLTLAQESNGVTLIHGQVPDQAALHGLLQRVRDTALPLISVVRLEPDEPLHTTHPR